jgi:hypothetical protein
MPLTECRAGYENMKKQDPRIQESEMAEQTSWREGDFLSIQRGHFRAASSSHWPLLNFAVVIASTMADDKFAVGALCSLGSELDRDAAELGAHALDGIVG